METPSSARRVTRSQTFAVLNNAANSNSSIPISRNAEDYEKSATKSRPRNAKQQQDRSALIDITNDSPIVGLAMETPSSAILKQRSSMAKNKTPGSGEALLRGQVKTLLQRVEEEAELSKISLERRFPHLQSFANSPMALLAPTPANTPQVANFSGDGHISNNGLGLVTASPVVEEEMKISQVIGVIFDGKEPETLESQKSMITRSLLLDFSEKSEISDVSELSSGASNQGAITGENESKDKSALLDDDDASIWSVQVNASMHDEDEEEVFEEDNEDDYYEEEEEEDGDDDDGGLVAELCEGLSTISVKERITAKFTGKHTRFIYNSDGEIEGEEECSEGGNSAEPEVMRLKGLPTPKGKHLRFPTED